MDVSIPLWELNNLQNRKSHKSQPFNMGSPGSIHCPTEYIICVVFFMFFLFCFFVGRFKFICFLLKHVFITNEDPGHQRKRSSSNLETWCK